MTLARTRRAGERTISRLVGNESSMTIMIMHLWTTMPFPLLRMQDRHLITMLSTVHFLCGCITCCRTWKKMEWLTLLAGCLMAEVSTSCIIVVACLLVCLLRLIVLLYLNKLLFFIDWYWTFRGKTDLNSAYSCTGFLVHEKKTFVKEVLGR